MHLSAIIPVYNDHFYIKEVIDSILPYVDSICIVEGAYKKTIDCGYPARSNDGTLEIIHEYDDPKITIELHNELYAIEQRQKLIQMAINNKADWVLLVDADEVYDVKSIMNVRKLIENDTHDRYLLPSRIFTNNFWTWHRGEMPRLYKINSNSRFVTDNHVDTVNGYGAVDPNDICFYHYSFLKNDDSFNCKYKHLKYDNPSFNEKAYQKYDEAKYMVATDGNGFYPFNGEHPPMMMNHPRYAPKPNPNNHWKELNTKAGINELKPVKWIYKEEIINE